MNYDQKVIKLHLGYGRNVNKLSLKRQGRPKTTVTCWCKGFASKEISNEATIVRQLVLNTGMFTKYMARTQRGKVTAATASKIDVKLCPWIFRNLCTKH